MITLRPDQEDLIGRVRARFSAGHRCVLMVAQTGFGKTVCFSWLAQSAVSKGRRVLILVHRDALIDQVSKTLARFEVEHSFIAQERTFNPRLPVQVASVFTLARRIGKISWRPDLIIVDEAHHAIPGSTWNKVLAAYQDKRVLGATATPERLGGQGLIDTFECMELGPPMRDLIDIGALADFKLYRHETGDVNVAVRGGDYVRSELAKAKNTRVITGDAVSHYQQFANGRKAIAFCVDIAHARAVAEQFKAAGYRAASIDGDMTRDAQRDRLADFSTGSLQVMTSCDLVGEGLDVPSIECGIFLRDTQSLALARQQIGRVLRAAPGKDWAILLDHAGLTKTHGWPDDEVEWSLEGKAKRKAGKPNLSVRTCGQCFASLRAASLSCKYCGFEFPVEPKKVKVVEGELVEAKRQEAVDKEAAREEVANAKSIMELVKIGKARGYKNAGWWAKQVFDNRGRG